MNDNHILLKLIVGGIATIALYSILYRENKFYRFFEHVYIGLAVGFSVVGLWVENLEASWWNTMIGKAAGPDGPGTPGMWTFGLLLPIGLMGFMVFSKKHGWMARIPIGIILGMWGGQQFNAFATEMLPQVRDSARILLPTRTDSLIVPHGFVLSPERAAAIAQSVGAEVEDVNQIAQNVDLYPAREEALVQSTGLSLEQVTAVAGEVRGLIGKEVYLSQAINNIIYTLTLLSILTYFLFSFEQKGKFLNGFTRAGRLLLMVGFGAIFGSTVMTRFALLIDRMFFIWIEMLRDGIFRMGG